jgi:hypothetical protein
MPVGELDQEIKNMLLEREEILLIAEQARFKPGGSITTPNKIYITNMRVLYKDPRMFGLKANIVDVNYVDISNIRLKRGLFSTEIYLKSRFLSDEVRLPAIEKSTAQQVSSMIQKGTRGELPNQKITVEKNAPVVEARASEIPMERLEKISDLKQKGLLTDDEFSKLKAEIIKEL